MRTLTSDACGVPEKMGDGILNFGFAQDDEAFVLKKEVDQDAGVIESRSLGMKGTHIRITNEKFGQVVRSQKGVSLMR